MTTQAQKIQQIEDDAAKRYRKLNRLVGKPVPNSQTEKIELWMSYSLSEAQFNGDFWNIPEYTNGTTRKVQCLFLLGPMHTGNGTHCYIGDSQELKRRLENSETEKILSSMTINGTLVEIIWSYDMCEPSRDGDWYYLIDEFWFGLRINGQLIQKALNISSLQIPKLRQKCGYCERVKSINKMELSNGQYSWVCKCPKELYSSCPK